MPTARITVSTPAGRRFRLRALLDTGSQVNLVTSRCVRRLGLLISPTTTALHTLGNIVLPSSNGRVRFHLHQPGDPPRLPVRAEVVQHITPAQQSFPCWRRFADLPLADPHYFVPGNIDVLLGMPVMAHLFAPAQLPPMRGVPGAFQTSLGWVIAGPFDSEDHLFRHRRVRFAADTVFYEASPIKSSRLRAGQENHPTLPVPGTSSAPSPPDASSSSPVSSSVTESEAATSTSSSAARLLSASSSEIAAASRETTSSASPALISTAAASSPASSHVSRLSTVDTSSVSISADPLMDIVRRFWELERVPDRLPHTPSERDCEEQFARTVSRTAEGRYIVSLPFIEDSPRLGWSHTVATRQFLRLEARLSRQPDLQLAYHAFMRDYLDSGHMALISPAADPPPYEPYYIPHHPVHRPDDPPTKLRVVFNASCASSNGRSLNDLLHPGPKLQADIATLLLRFRLPAVVFTADIRQMYRQILVTPHHQDYQRIVWRFSSTEPLQSYRLTTVTYGVSSAPFLALRTLQQLAQDEGSAHPDAARVLRDSIYVDDALTGADTPDAALALRRQLQHLLMAGGFELRKWATNHPPLLHDIPVDHHRIPPTAASSDVSEGILLDKDPVIKVLGLGWNPSTDCFFYAVRMNETSRTKRSILSQMARIFDPLGWLTPVTFSAKLMFRQLCLLGVDWDQPLPASAITSWETFQSQLPDLRNLSISRLLNYTASDCDLHLIGFCDASEAGYSACVYLRSASPGGQTSIALLSAKSKVAPTKQTSLPRLELCGAHLLAQLLDLISTRMLSSLRMPVTAFCDSTVTLAWIRGESHRWKAFVGNRVAAIQELLPSAAWRHVRSEDNPADCASRGLEPRAILRHHLWWHGPAWLASPPDAWPTFTPVAPLDDIIAEERSTSAHVLLAVTSEPGIEERFSSLTRLRRVIARCLRFAFNCRHPAARRTGHLTTGELQEALQRVVRQVQYSSLAVERREARNPSSRLRRVRQLHLFLDDDDILRVGGRLSASSLQYAHRHPALLPKAHHLTTLIIDDAHHRLLHAGALATHAFIRQQFWIPDGRNVTRLRLRACNRCFTCKPSPIIQPLGSLPPERVTAASAFLTTGVDYAGPFFTTSARLRGAAVTKAYLVVFICFATKAVHFEIASDLSSAAFIAAYRRFVSRRGHPAVIFSDNGTNFVGAQRELSELRRLLKSAAHQQLLSDAASAWGTDWRFIPPSSPHFGGLWEAAVKSAKHHLRRTIGEQRLTYEELFTVCAQVEAILNSRPLFAPSADPLDLEVLTPGHFLIGRPLTAAPDVSLISVPLTRLSRWQLLQRIQQDFWKRWNQEYLHTLQQRSKWLQPASSVSPGTVVLIKEDHLPPLQWSIGRISALHPGPDNVSRVADVRTSSGVLRRPLCKLCPLPSQ